MDLQFKQAKWFEHVAFSFFSFCFFKKSEGQISLILKVPQPLTPLAVIAYILTREAVYFKTKRFSYA